MPIVVPLAWGHMHERVKEFMVWLLVMETGMLGVFVALDLVLFYVFWEVSLVPLYFMIGIWGGRAAPVRGDQVLPVHVAG